MVQMNTDVSRRFGEIDRSIGALERTVAERPELALTEVLEPAIGLVNDTMRAYLAAAGDKAPPPADADVLEVWRALVKGDPTWNAIRDNCRELVFYRNCLAAGRTDALPTAAHRMAVRLARHVYLYVRTRCVREGRVAD
jgi:hypothetical protein